MTTKELVAEFNSIPDFGDGAEFLKFERVKTRFSNRPDLHAFILLDSLCPVPQKDRDIIGAAEHDKIWLDVEIDELAAVINQEQVRDLVRCGVMCDEEGLSMFA